MIFLSLLNLLFVSSLNSISLPSWLPEYLTPLGPGVKEECLAASHRYLDLLNVSPSGQAKLATETGAWLNLALASKEPVPGSSKDENMDME